MDNLEDFGGYGIAIIGMANRVPGANNPDEYWHNLKNGIESVTHYTDEQLAERGVTPDLLKNPHYVKAGCHLQNMDHFDPDFFGFSPKEAAILDPQHRHFYECAWEALERAGHPPSRFDGAVGVFAGSGTNAYFAQNLITNKELMNSVGHFLLRHTGNDKDFLATRVSYAFNLKGPSINVQTACSTSSVATHLACQSLLSEECDMALAGGVTLDIPHGLGYLYKEGEILSPDGHCRAFDHRSKGTIFGSGAGVVVLRRLEDAVRDGDHIHAVIIGSAVNNDGNSKVGYLAPSVEGQAEAITEALAIADVDADSIGYVECHGTGTPVGDPIEVAALTEAFNESTERTGYCGIGSVKTSIGHLDTAAGVASLIKASLALENKQLPPSLNYEAPNPTIDFVHSPFFVNDKLKNWKDSDEPRRAGVNSLGVGGTNAFVILEEAPELPPSCEFKGDYHLITFSAKSRKSLDGYSQKLADFLKENPELKLADAAYTLFEGREHFENRRVLAVQDHEEAIALLESLDQRRVFTHSADDSEKGVVFMFPGGGAQYVDMARGIYDSEAVFRKHMDQGFDYLKSKTGIDYKELLFVGSKTLEEIDAEQQKPGVQLPLIFLVEYALAKQWVSMGIEPAALIGHSMGENTAACLAGVIGFEDALGLVLLRGQLMDEVPEGGMLSVELPADELRGYLDDSMALATINSPVLSVASGKKSDLARLSEMLTSKGIENKAVAINIAAHSHLLDGILGRFGDYLRSITLNKPEIKFVSNYTGTWITDAEATDPEYWVKHLRNTVKFADGINTILADGESIFLEVGPGQTLGSLTRQNPNAPSQRVMSSLRHPKDETPDAAYFNTIYARLWAVGYELTKEQLWPDQKRKRIPLPTYAFNHNSYYIEPTEVTADTGQVFAALDKIEDKESWYRKPTWIQQGILAEAGKSHNWLVFVDDTGFGEKLVERMKAAGQSVVAVYEGDAYHQQSNTSYRLSPEVGLEGYAALISDLVSSGHFPDRILHLWSLTQDESFRPGSSFLHRNQEHGFYSLFFLARAIADADHADRNLHMLVYTNGMQQVQSEAVVYPEKSTVLGPCKVIPRELPNTTVACIDIDLPLPKEKSGLFGSRSEVPEIGPALIDMTLTDLFAPEENGFFAYRTGVRWKQVYDHCQFGIAKPLREIQDGSVVLITGGLGGIGYTMAQALAEQYNAKLVLVNRTPLPARNEWADWLKKHGHDDKISQAIRKVKDLEALGADVRVYAGDVTDLDRMKEILAESEQTFGPLSGVLHGAGALADGLIQMKNQSDIEDVFAPKIYGTLVLNDIFKGKELDFFIVFSSTSTVTAPIGQIDYVAANAFLNAFAQKRNNEEKGYTLALNWGVWNEVGLAASSAAKMGFGPQSNSLESHEVRHPLFYKRQSTTRNGRDLHYLRSLYGSTRQWVLDEHRTKAGQALLPGTAYIELARAALDEIGERSGFQLHDLIFLQALYVPENETVEARVKLEQTVEGYDFSIQSLTKDQRGNEGWQTHSEARIVLLTKEHKASADLDWVLDQLQLEKSTAVVASKKTDQEKHLNFGPRWALLRDAKYDASESAAMLYLDDRFVGDLEHYKVHPAILDIATGYAMQLIDGYSASDSQLWVPVSYATFTYQRPLTQKVFSWVKSSGSHSVKDGFASFDVSIFDEFGQLLVEVNKLTIKRLEGEVNFANSAPAGGLEKDDSLHESGDAEFRQLSPSELAFQHNLSQGILPKEGSEALFKVLKFGKTPEIIVSSLELEGLIKEVEATAAANKQEDDGAKFARPDLDSDFVEPRNDIERTLVGFWEELLGVDQVGVEDSFFDLGGHSLVAVRLFAKIQQAYGVDYPISVLFEAPTIAACAELLQEVVGEQESSNGEEVKDSAPKARYRHLVPMHSSKSSSKTPFFLVAGMFGNVLNLRHLAQLIGNERPFYGLQARGLLGEETPHETFEEAAADYIEEILTVQEDGPFILGGFSGGGITAYEIARQLKERGKDVAEIILLDTPLPYNDPLSSVDKMSIHWQRIRSKGFSYFSEWAKNRYYWEVSKFKKRFGEIDEPELSPAEFKSGVIEAAFYRSLGRYDIKSLNIKTKLFRPKLPVEYELSGGRAANSDRHLIMEDNGWLRYVDDLEVFEVPGNHDSMVLEPNVRVLATKMRQCIDDAD